MIDTILLLGLLALFVGWRRTAARVQALEARIFDLDDAHVAVAPPSPTARASVPVTRPAILVAELAEAGPGVGDKPVVAAEPVDQAESLQDSTPKRETVSGLFERFVGGRLLVWTGGIAMALAGLFLVRYSIELGLIGPRVRMIAAALFGVVLVAAGELARRRVPGDPRVGQALVGAGVLVLYAAAYGSHILYGLITLTSAFVLMAAIAAGALFLSLRHGTPTAALGLVAAFATPLLVGRSTGEAAPLLMYLALLNIAVFAVAVRSARPWLAWAARFMTLGWTGSLLVSAHDDALTIGAFLLVHMVATGLTSRGDGGRDGSWRTEPLPSLGPTLALAQMGAVVPLAHFAPAGWGLLFGFGLAGFALADWSRVLAAVPARALTAALLLVAGQIEFGGEPSVLRYAAAATTILFAGGAWWRLDRSAGRVSPTLIFCAAVAGPAILIRFLDASHPPIGMWGALFAALAVLPAALAWRMREAASRDAPFDRALLAAAATAAGLLCVAVPDLLSSLWSPAGWMLVALGTAAAGRRSGGDGDGGVRRLAIIVLAGAVIAAAVRALPIWAMLVEAAFGSPALAAALPPIGGSSPVGAACALFGLPAAIAVAVWRVLPVHERAPRRIAGIAAGVLGGVMAYMAYKQLFGLRDEADFVARGFAERTLLTQGLFFAGWLLLKRPRLPWLIVPALALTAVAAARFAWFDLLVYNPAMRTQDVGAWPGLNLILPAYLGSGFWLFEARRREKGRVASLWLALLLAALIVGAGLLVRQLFQGAILTGTPMPRAEFYGYSLAGLLLSVGLLMFGARRGDTPLRVAGLGLLTATVVKVFVFDAAALEGLLRIASFAGLGAALIGMGKLYGTVLGRARTPLKEP